MGCLDMAIGVACYHEGCYFSHDPRDIVKLPWLKKRVPQKKRQRTTGDYFTNYGEQPPKQHKDSGGKAQGQGDATKTLNANKAKAGAKNTKKDPVDLQKQEDENTTEEGNAAEDHITYVQGEHDGSDNDGDVHDSLYARKG